MSIQTLAYLYNKEDLVSGSCLNVQKSLTDINTVIFQSDTLKVKTRDDFINTEWVADCYIIHSLIK